VTGYINDTVPVAVQTWLGNPRDFRAAVVGTIACGGDADTSAALVGGLVGTGVGPAEIPAAWLRGLAEWRRSAAWLERLAGALDAAPAGGARPPSLPGIPLVMRNLGFLAVVLAHGFYRLRPW
jgi:hypothetical protein